jgi:uncharacterized protein YPO0396
MPITNPLHTAQRLEALGFPARQAQGLAEILEEAIQANNQDLKEFIRGENERLRAEIRAEFAAVRAEFKADMAELRGEIAGVRSELKADLAGLRAEMHSALREQLMRFITIVFGLVTLAVAIIKLFPNLF